MQPGRVSGVGSVRVAVADQRIGLAVDFEGVFLTDAAQVTDDVARQHLRRVDIGIAAELSDLRQFMGEGLRPLENRRQAAQHPLAGKCRHGTADRNRQPIEALRKLGDLEVGARETCDQGLENLGMIAGHRQFVRYNHGNDSNLNMPCGLFVWRWLFVRCRQARQRKTNRRHKITTSRRSAVQLMTALPFQPTRDPIGVIR
jgi:hypothetical protein